MKLITIALTSLAISACVSAPVSGDLSVVPDKDGNSFRVEDSATASPLIKSTTDLGSITISGERLSFHTTGSGRKHLDNQFGHGTCFIYKGQSVSGPEIRRELRLSIYDAFPSTIIVDAVYQNDSGDTLKVDGWSMFDLQVQAGEPEPYFWSFQGQSSAYREDWIKPVGEEFYQRNFMGMNPAEGHADYGGGIPVVCLWRRDAGVIIGHIDPSPQLVSLPVDKKPGNDYADISIVKEFNESFTLAPGKSLSTYTCFISVYTGDCFGALRNYAGLLDKVGIKMPVSGPEAYQPAWCAWGYERKFTIAEIIGTLPKVQELGFKWATLDDGFQIAEGDWDLTRERFPNGDADMKYMVDEFHKHGLKAELWWAPLAADPGTEFLRKYPDALILDKEGGPHKIEWWDSWYLSPLDEDVRREQSALVHKFIADYGFDGLKLDGQHMNCVAPDYNPLHHPEDPEKSSRELPGFYDLIQKTAKAVKPNAVIQYCPCGDCFSVYNLPYIDKAVSSDPTSSWQIRTKGYVLRALAPQLAYYGDHIELSDNGNDYPTQLGIGAVIGTKFTWPKDNPYAEHSYLLTPEKEALLRNALKIFEEKQLAKGQYVPGLYDIGFDYPETHVLTQDGKLYYAFYATSGPVDSVELRGLRTGMTYRIEDYYNHRDLGTVTASDKTVLQTVVDGSLLIEVSEVTL
ncbi:MAG: alpha-galactosidase [Bacteroidales bacterium]|nr:alpha-galactosidase [Bacteroidales bacterium]